MLSYHKGNFNNLISLPKYAGPQTQKKGIINLFCPLSYTYYLDFLYNLIHFIILFYVPQKVR